MLKIKHIRDELKVVNYKITQALLAEINRSEKRTFIETRMAALQQELGETEPKLGAPPEP